MKVILSRKGFDSSNGGRPSPILPDGTLLSLPIPSIDGLKYSDISYNGTFYKDIIKQLYPNFSADNCHLDPDIRQGVFNAPSNWTAVFGQNSAPLTHLINQGVKEDDLFLFFGWFKQTAYDNDRKLRYVRGAVDRHIIYGYLQVGKMVTDPKEMTSYNWHAHTTKEYESKKNNNLFVARDTCSWDKNIKGYGTFTYSPKVVLSKEGMSRSFWNLPNFFKNATISAQRQNAWGDNYYHSPDIGQEFVIADNAEVEAWAKKVIRQ